MWQDPNFRPRPYLPLSSRLPLLSPYQGSGQGPSLHSCRCQAQPGQSPSVPPEPTAVGGRFPPSQVSGFLGLLPAQHPCSTHPGQRRRRECRTLPFLSAALHGPTPQRCALHTHHSGHTKVRHSPGPLPGFCPPRASHLPSAWCPQGTGCAEGLRARLAATHLAL